MTSVTLIWKNSSHHYRTVQWCELNIGQHGRGWLGNFDHAHNAVFHFERESDATMFKLRWS